MYVINFQKKWRPFDDPWIIMRSSAATPKLRWRQLFSNANCKAKALRYSLVGREQIRGIHSSRKEIQEDWLTIHITLDNKNF
jgi:hypothetical protein